MTDYDYIAREVAKNIQRSNNRASGKDYSFNQAAPVGRLDFPTAPRYNFSPLNYRLATPDYSQKRPDLMRLGIPGGVKAAVAAMANYERPNKESGKVKPVKGADKVEKVPSDPTVPYSDYGTHTTFPDGGQVLNPTPAPGVPYSTVKPQGTFPQGNEMPGLGNASTSPRPGIPYGTVQGQVVKPNGDPFPTMPGLGNVPTKPQGPGITYTDVRTRTERRTPGAPAQTSGTPWSPTLPSQPPSGGFSLNMDGIKARPPKGIPYSRLSDGRTINADNLPMVRDNIMPGTPEAEEYKQKMRQGRNPAAQQEVSQIGGTASSPQGPYEMVLSDPPPSAGRRRRNRGAAQPTVTQPTVTQPTTPVQQPGASVQTTPATPAPGLAANGTLAAASTSSTGNLPYGVQPPKSDVWRVTSRRRRGMITNQNQKRY